MEKRLSLEEYLEKNPKKYLIFDFDKTLYTLHLPWGEYLEHTYDLLKEYNPVFFAKAAVNNESNFQLINKFTREFGPGPRDIALEYACTFEVEELTGVSPCQDQLDFLAKYKDKYDLFVWTSNCTTTVEPILKEKGLHSLFELVVGRDTVTYCKPDPDGFSIIKRHVEANIEEDPQLEDFLMIGDSNSDEGAAYHADIDFYRVQ